MNWRVVLYRTYMSMVPHGWNWFHPKKISLKSHTSNGWNTFAHIRPHTKLHSLVIGFNYENTCTHNARIIGYHCASIGIIGIVCYKIVKWDLLCVYIFGLCGCSHSHRTVGREKIQNSRLISWRNVSVAHTRVDICVCECVYIEDSHTRKHTEFIHPYTQSHSLTRSLARSLRHYMAYYVVLYV